MSELQNPIKSIGSKLKPLKQGPELSSLQYGRVLPQALPLEEAVLGAIMLDKDALPMVIELLRGESFYASAHQEIYNIMTDLFNKSQPIDLLTVHEGLKKAGKLNEIGGVNYLMEISNKVASAANIEYHARIIAQKYIQRELIRVSTHTIKDSFEDSKDVFELLDEAEQSLYDITDKNLNTGFEKIGALAVKAQREIEILSQQEGGLTGVSTGFEELDKITSGWQPSDLVIIAARPGMGKTAFTLSLARNAAGFGKPVAVFSLEMASMQLVQRLISMEAEIDSRKLRNGQLEEYEWTKLHSAIEKMSELPIFIDDTPAINIFELRAKCRRLKQNHDIELVIIDYLQLMSAAPNEKRGNREQEISSISRSLKSLAKELNVPVLALSQLSRAVETRGGNKRPQLSDLRESGAIEQDADIVTFIYRPDYYELEDTDTPKGTAEIIISKHRNGALGNVFLRFIPEHVKFVDANFDTFSGSTDLGDLADPFNSGIITRPSRMNEDFDQEMPFD
jgi:replicative DNA helicase